MSKPKTLNKKTIALVVVLAIFIAIAAVGLDDPKKVWFSLTNLNPFFLLLGIACFFLAWLAEALLLHNLIKHHAFKQQTIRQSFGLLIIGKLFDNLTPSATGGQPFQAWKLSQSGVRVGVALAILAFKFAIYQFVLVAYSLIIVGLNFSQIQTWQTGKIIAILVGTSVNIATTVFLLIAVFNPNLLRKISYKFINALAKIKLLSDPAAAKKSIASEIKLLNDGFKTIAQHKQTVFRTVILSFLQLTALFSVAFCLFLPAKISLADWFASLSSSCYVWMFSSFVPLPGASIGSEGGFVLFFSDILNQQSSVSVAMLAWRFVTYYLPIIIGAIFVIRNKSFKKLNSKPTKTTTDTSKPQPHE